MELKTEKRNLLSILNAWKKDGTEGEIPWHITDLGWLTYANHSSEEVRNAALNNPYYGCSSDHLQQQRIEYKINAKAFA